MAQVILEQLLAARGLRARVTSAGIAAADGAPAAAAAVQVMQEQGLDLSGHEAKLLTPALIDEADLILTMSSAQKDAIRDMNAGAIEKTFSLAEFVGRSGDVDDPVGQSVEVYRQTAARLRQLLEQAVEKVDFTRQGNSNDV